eukprot:TRINITY_DN4669_c0_g1_i1.p1 TRINITY_DN4669_c0_g1~~TRINITY_DN4669_c0_g1_i1.p1  ORF type:complete len:314 (+),score=103.51 TRINITY_DN4669_c0_g1_i1:23-943(+)
MASPNGASSCPVDHTAMRGSNPHPLIPSSASHPPSPSSTTSPSPSPLSASHTSENVDALNPTNNMPKPNQLPHADQRYPLPTNRITSTIPRGGHGAPEDDKWSYPSPQMFFNAMKKKGWEGMREEDMTAVVAIHNTVNEKCWDEIRKWEEKYRSTCANPKLVKFSGRAKDFSPKARMYNFFGYTLPFDRHDWTVDRCGQEVRYIIDFYEGKKQPGKAASIYLDVRPALDSVGAFVDTMQFKIQKAFASSSGSSSSSSSSSSPSSSSTIPTPSAGTLKPTEGCPVDHTARAAAAKAPSPTPSSSSSS